MMQNMKIQALNTIDGESKSMTKAQIKASSMFGYELIEEVVPDTAFYQSQEKVSIGTLCRTSSGIRFVVDGGIYISLENEEIDTVECHRVSATGCSPWHHFGCKALTFTKLDSSEQLSFAVSTEIAKSWANHFDLG